VRPTPLSTNRDVEQIDLLRGGVIVSSLAGALGSNLRETRLTAMLGYLVALHAEKFCALFKFEGVPRAVSLETRHAKDRSDIVVSTSEGLGVIEAKVGNHDPFDQALKYPARWRVLLTEYEPTSGERARDCLYLRWRALVPLLRDLGKSNRAAVRFVSDDLQRYLEEHNMIPRAESVEIYARELNDIPTVMLFLQGHMYGCHYKPGSRLPEALYFAPHFGHLAVASVPGIRYGISYLARIETVEVVESFSDLRSRTEAIRGKQWLKKHRELLEPVRSWPEWHKTERVSFVFLNQPQLVFNPPIRKDSLQKGTRRGSAFLSKHFLSFEELFAAWGQPAL
jgi:hypothetical protein